VACFPGTGTLTCTQHGDFVITVTSTSAVDVGEIGVTVAPTVKAAAEVDLIRLSIFSHR
jgi:hypothetical protein